MQLRYADYLSSEKIHLLFCGSRFEPPVPFFQNRYAPLTMCPKKDTPIKKHKIPPASVTAAKSKKSPQ